MNTNSPDLKKLLLKKGIKPTLQRMKVLEYLQREKDHPTADRIYQALVREIPTMSKTTVYNTLKALQEKGIVSAVHITGTEVRYDLAAWHHHHFLCERCGRIIDIAVTCPNLSREEIQGHHISELHGYFKGVCASCCAKRK